MPNFITAVIVGVVVVVNDDIDKNGSSFLKCFKLIIYFLLRYS